MELNEQLEMAKFIQEEIIRKCSSLNIGENITRNIKVIILGDSVTLQVPEIIDEIAVFKKRKNFLADCIEDGINNYRRLNNQEEGEIINGNDIHK